MPTTTALKLHSGTQEAVKICLGIFTPLILLANLGLFLRCEVIGDIECFSDFLRRLALDHTGDSGTGEIQQRLYIHEIGGQDKLEKNILFHSHKVGVPFLYNLIHIRGLQRLHTAHIIHIYDTITLSG